MRFFAIVNLVIGVLAFPVFGLAILFGLSGSDPGNYLLMVIGYGGVLASAVGTLFNTKYFKFIFASYCVLWLGRHLDQEYWHRQNVPACARVKADPNCIKTPSGFDCSKSTDSENRVSGSVCKE
jgi:hypothetical protein